MPTLYVCGEDVGGVDQADPQADPARYRADVEHCREALHGGTSLDVIAVQRRNGRHVLSVRWICVHLVQEHARHDGHADLLRERLAASTGT